MHLKGCTARCIKDRHIYRPTYSGLRPKALRLTIVAKKRLLKSKIIVVALNVASRTILIVELKWRLTKYNNGKSYSNY